MSGKVFLVLLSFLMIYSFKQYSPGSPVLKSILSKYNRADRLFYSSNNSPLKDSVCIAGFNEVIYELNSISRSVFIDSLLYQANYKLGIMCDVNKDYARATSSYLQAMKYTSDSGKRFSLNVLSGSGYYNLNNFDSASYFLLRAEESPGEWGSFEDRIRLYNTLGVLYYDNGNYLQSKNYFNQALQLIEAKNPSDDFVYSLQLNMATCFYKLGLFEQALILYRKILKFQLLPDPLYMNMGRAYAGLHQYTEALASFKKVKVRAIPGVLNEMARTALETGNPDSASAWLKQYQREKKSIRSNSLDDGVNELYSGDLDIFNNQPESALRHFQKSLIIFSGNFTDKDIHKNPGNFTGSFAYYRLFEVLVKKASAWEMEYKRTSNPDDLKSAYDSYQSTISFLSYIERSYEMDDAKILLKQKSSEVYTNALIVCLELNKLFPNTGYEESAFLITEKNKASVMNAQLRERSFLLSVRTGNDVAGQERNIKFNIARLNSKAEEEVNAQALQKINNEKSAYEIQLINLRRKMEGDNRFYQLKYSDDFPAIEQLQKSIGSDQSLISFYNTSEKIEVFVLTNSSFHLIELDSGEAIRRNIISWIRILQTSEGGRHVNTNRLKENLYTQFMKPVISLAGNKDEWIIIPDGLLFLLPFESLQGDMDGSLILEKHTISYEFSARFIVENRRYFNIQEVQDPVLSFAPFSQKGADLKAEGMGWLEKLPYSKEEISGLKGRRFENQNASKKEFIKNLNSCPIVHLATHAITDMDNPSASYIAFFPATGIRSEDFLFLDEIYSLRLDSCELMVISACETGRGEYIKNEGVMSFARAFLYAGCPSTINTLWKADDHSTSEIFRIFYKYLEAGYSKSQALQKAKIDFIKNNPVNRDPAFWSHIILTGDPGSLYKKKQPWIWTAFLIAFGTIVFFLIGKRMKKKSTPFTANIGILK
jgi:CHAT domain-containing protein